MKVSLNLLKKFVEIVETPEQLAEELTLLGLEVESIDNLSAKFNGFVVAEVLEKEKHPNADKLSICYVKYGDNLQTVVCGAPNVDVGQKVILGLEGAVVPSAGFALDRRKIRGVESCGMICSQTELELGEDSSGIWVLPSDAVSGTPLSDYLNINDAILDISITPNRAECLSHYGIAREIATLKQRDLIKPKIEIFETENKASDNVNITILDTDRCPRYSARLIKNVKITESPEWLKKLLLSLGLRPINVAVDITNYVMYLIGQPLHAFDFDCLENGEIVVRTANQDETIITLDGKERKLLSSDLLICDTNKAIAIAGVMGGENSEITNSTTNILLESAYFQPSTVRKTSKRLALQSDASYRYERSADVDITLFAADLAAGLIAEYTGGEICNGIVDAYPGLNSNRSATMRLSQLNKISGVDIPKDRCLDILTRLGFSILSNNDEQIEVEIPNYRSDVSDEIDLIEECCRFFAYKNIPPQFRTAIDFSEENVPTKLSRPTLRDSLSRFMISNGWNELVTQNQIDSKTAALFSANYVKLANALSEELDAMRPSLLPSILKIVSLNLRRGASSVRLFNLGKIFIAQNEDENFINGITEKDSFVVALAGSVDPKFWQAAERNYDFYDIKGLANDIAEFLGLELKLKPSENSIGFGANSLTIYHKKQKIGGLGEIAQKLLKRFEIEQPVFVLELDVQLIYSISNSKAGYQKISSFPSVKRDLAFLVDDEVPAERILNAVSSKGGKLLTAYDVFDVYKGKNLGENKKSIAVSLVFSSNERTLVENEIDTIIEEMIKAAEKSCGAILRRF